MAVMGASRGERTEEATMAALQRHRCPRSVLTPARTLITIAS